MITMTIPKFPLGQVVATPGVLQAFEQAGTKPAKLLHRHMAGDWGDLSKSDWQSNDRAVRTGYRLMSCYCLPNKTKVWIITESDRAVTTFLLPSEY